MDGAGQQRVQTHAMQSGDTPQDTPKDGECGREDYVWHHNDLLSHVGQTGADLTRKTVRSVLGDLTSYAGYMLVCPMGICKRQFVLR